MVFLAATATSCALQHSNTFSLCCGERRKEGHALWAGSNQMGYSLCPQPKRPMRTKK